MIRDKSLVSFLFLSNDILHKTGGHSFSELEFNSLFENDDDEARIHFLDDHFIHRVDMCHVSNDLKASFKALYGFVDGIPGYEVSVMYDRLNDKLFTYLHDNVSHNMCPWMSNDLLNGDFVEHLYFFSRESALGYCVKHFGEDISFCDDTFECLCEQMAFKASDILFKLDNAPVSCSSIVTGHDILSDGVHASVNLLYKDKVDKDITWVNRFDINRCDKTVMMNGRDFFEFMDACSDDRELGWLIDFKKEVCAMCEAADYRNRFISHYSGHLGEWDYDPSNVEAIIDEGAVDEWASETGRSRELDYDVFDLLDDIREDPSSYDHLIKGFVFYDDMDLVMSGSVPSGMHSGPVDSSRDISLNFLYDESDDKVVMDWINSNNGHIEHVDELIVRTEDVCSSDKTDDFDQSKLVHTELSMAY